MPDDEAIAAIRDELEGLVERLDDLIYQALSQVVELGEQKRPDAERRLTRVRNALERARAILRED